nr:hypothetical protein [Candidatus Kuenenia stuttgartiensis]
MEKIVYSVTDENRKRRTDPGNPEICNLFTLHKHYSSIEQIERINRECRTAEIGCVECKKILYENIIKALSPIREKYEELIKDKHSIIDILHEGAKKCKNMAEITHGRSTKTNGTDFR